MSKDAQEKYIKDHPTSLKARNAKAKNNKNYGTFP